MGEIQYIHGTVLDEELQCTLAELCRLCGVNPEIIHDMVDEGVITPRGTSPVEWHFTSIEIKRVQTAVRLQNDLQVNLAGCALVLDLLEEIDELKLALRRR